MNDLISRKALIKAIETIEARYGNDNSSLIEQGEVLDLIAEAPTIDAESVKAKSVKHGHWITHNEGNPFEIYGECSICGCSQSISDHLNYCPDCGAKMG